MPITTNNTYSITENLPLFTAVVSTTNTTAAATKSYFWIREEGNWEEKEGLKTKRSKNKTKQKKQTGITSSTSQFIAHTCICVSFARLVIVWSDLGLDICLLACLLIYYRLPALYHGKRVGGSSWLQLPLLGCSSHLDGLQSWMLDALCGIWYFWERHIITIHKRYLNSCRFSSFLYIVSIHWKHFCICIAQFQVFSEQDFHLLRMLVPISMFYVITMCSVFTCLISLKAWILFLGLYVFLCFKLYNNYLISFHSFFACNLILIEFNFLSSITLNKVNPHIFNILVSFYLNDKISYNLTSIVFISIMKCIFKFSNYYRTGGIIFL